MKLGKLPHVHDVRDLMFAAYKTTTLKEAPIGFTHTALLPSLGMLGNDQYGDCAEAGACHETMLWTAAGSGSPAPFTDAAALNLYAAVTGFNPTTGAGDNGTDVRSLLKYRQKTGVTDASGRIHKIGAYLALEPGNWEELLEALYCFEAVGIGIQFPASAMTQFNAGKPWTVIKGSKIDGGHYIPVVSRTKSTYVDVITWGALEGMSKSFYTTYCDESWAILSPETLAGTGKTLEGFNLSQLQADLSAL